MQPRSTIDELDDVEIVPIALPLDRGTVAWLCRISHANDAAAAEIIATMLRAIREDDEESHRVLN